MNMSAAPRDATRVQTVWRARHALVYFTTRDVTRRARDVIAPRRSSRRSSVSPGSSSPGKCPLVSTTTPKARTAVGFDFYPNTHRIPTEKPAGIVTESLYPQIVFAYPDIRIYPLILWQPKIRIS